MDDWEIVPPSGVISDENSGNVVDKAEMKAESLPRCKQRGLVGDFDVERSKTTSFIHPNCSCIPESYNSCCFYNCDEEIPTSYTNFGTDNTAEGKFSYMCSGCGSGSHGDRVGSGHDGNLCVLDDQGRHGNWQLTCRKNDTLVNKIDHGSGFSGHNSHPDVKTSRFAAQLRIASSKLKDLNSNGFHSKKNLTSLVCDLNSLSLVELLKTAAVRVDQLEAVEDELHCTRHLLRLQKSRNRKLQEDNIRLEMSLKEVNMDYGQLLVEYDSRHKNLEPQKYFSVHPVAVNQKVDKFTQTPVTLKVDVGTDVLLSNKSLATQTELQEPPKSDEADQATGNDSNVSEVLQTESCNRRDVVAKAPSVENSQGPNTTSRVRNERKPATLNGTEVRHETGLEASNRGSADGGNNENQTASSVNETSDHQAVRERSESSSSGNGRPLSTDQPRSADTNCATVPSIPWPCSHYKRRCVVKFACCDDYYPCHRCHNKDKKCPEKNMKSKDAILLKCLACNESQQFTELSQNCRNCGIKFGDYFCHHCQHLTGTDDNPYHCDKCGICRVNGDRSFHCDVCNVCLDVQLLGNHVCREGSAHDPCGICFEDAFFGCQLLPCSHKVHKDCAKLMIENGVRCCPVCRQSFAHRFQRR